MLSDDVGIFCWRASRCGVGIVVARDRDRVGVGGWCSDRCGGVDAISMELARGGIITRVFGIVHMDRVSHDRLDWQASFVEHTIKGEASVSGEWSQNSFSASVPITWERCFDSDCPALRSLLTVPIVQPWVTGELVRVECRLTLPKNFSDDFDYVSYLAKEDIGTICTPKKIPERLHEVSWESGLFHIRQQLERSLSASVPEPENGLLAGLIFGGSQRLPATLQNDFKKTGVSHIVAVSGYNVLIVAEILLLFGIVLGLWRSSATWFAVGGIWLFALVTGAGASVLRAALMATIVLLATQFGRLVAPWRLMILMLMPLLWFNPFLLRYDIGFQLSCIATAVLLFWFLGDDERDDSSGWRMMYTLMKATLMIEVFVAPLLLSQFGFVSTVSLLSNVLILPFVPIAMALAFVTAVSGLVLPWTLNVFAWLGYLLARYMLEVVAYLGQQPWSTVSLPVSWWGIILWYAGWGWIWYRYQRKKRMNI